MRNQYAYNQGLLLCLPIIMGVIYLVGFCICRRTNWWLLKLVGGILAFVSIIACGMALVRNMQRENIARVDINSIELAVSNYLLTLQTNKGALTNSYFGQDNQQELMEKLTGVISNMDVFLLLPSSRLSRGKFIDPWGRPYNIAIDISGKGVVQVPFVGNISNRSVVAWSFGPTPVWDAGF